VLRRYLADRGQSIIAEHFELYLTLGEAIVDRVYGEAEPSCPGQLFFVLNTESSFALGVGDAISELEGAHDGIGQAFYDTLRQSLYRWIRVYDDLDAQERIEQMTERATVVPQKASDTEDNALTRAGWPTSCKQIRARREPSTAASVADVSRLAGHEVSHPQFR
jgi:hypothetical protein